MIQTTDPLEIEQQAKILSVKVAIKNYVGICLETLDKLSAQKISEKQADDILDKAELVTATKIVNDLSPKKSIIV